MIQKKNSVLIRKKRMRIEGNRKNHEITRGCAMKRRRCSAIFVGNLRRQTPLHQQKGVQISVPLKIKMSPKILAKGTNCPQWSNPSSNPESLKTKFHGVYSLTLAYSVYIPLPLRSDLCSLRKNTLLAMFRINSQKFQILFVKFKERNSTM